MATFQRVHGDEFGEHKDYLIQVKTVPTESVLPSLKESFSQPQGSFSLQTGVRPCCKRSHFWTYPHWYNMGTLLRGREGTWVNHQAVRARAGVIMSLALLMLFFSSYYTEYEAALYICPILIFDAAASISTGLTPLCPIGVVGTLATVYLPPVWKTASPYRFSWMLEGSVAIACLIVRIIMGNCLVMQGLIIAILVLSWLETCFGISVFTGLYELVERFIDSRECLSSDIVSAEVYCHNKERGIAFEESRCKFLESVPGLADLEEKLRVVRIRDFPQLDAQCCIYLDYTGAMLAPSSLVQRHSEMLLKSILGNPHSENAPSVESSKMDFAARHAVLRLLNASPAEYQVIWTPNASGALKLVGESYQFGSQGSLIYAPDCHNSVSLRTTMRGKAGMGGKLVVMPGQSNASGIKHPIKECISIAKENGWDVLLDAAALAPSGGLDLSEVSPDFVSLSFYKIFGYPTGIGALIAKTSSLPKLQRPWFGGGTVRIVSADPTNVIAVMHPPNDTSHWEDGTINFQLTAAITNGVEYMESIGMSDIRLHTESLASWVASSLRSLKWSNGRTFAFLPDVLAPSKQGSSVSFLPLLDDGTIIPAAMIEAMAKERGIAVRTGCFCNPGTGVQLLEMYWGKRITGRPNSLHDLEVAKETTGLLRVSVGLPTSFGDVYAFIKFIKTQLLDQPDSIRKQAQKWLADKHGVAWRDGFA